MVTKEGSTKIVNFMESVAGICIVGCGHLSHFSDYELSSTLSIYSILVAILFRELMLLFQANVDFY